VDLIVKAALIISIVLGVDYALRCGYMLIELLQDRWYERPPSKYFVAAHHPSGTGRLLGALVTIGVTLALL
jgi:hypothetical protein